MIYDFASLFFFFTSIQALHFHPLASKTLYRDGLLLNGYRLEMCIKIN